jgi:hypothetical protein
MNMLFSYMLVRSYCVAKEAHQAATMLKQMATLRAFQKAAFLQQLSLANWQLDLPQWDTVCNKVRAGLTEAHLAALRCATARRTASFSLWALPLNRCLRRRRQAWGESARGQWIAGGRVVRACVCEAHAAIAATGPCSSLRVMAWGYAKKQGRTGRGMIGGLVVL